MTDLKKLADEIKGKYWNKGTKERVYLNRGYNTKKMKTTTYVEQVNGNFNVRCFIDCPSQPYQWIESQQNEIIEDVENEITNIKDRLDATHIYTLVDEQGNYLDDSGNIVRIDLLVEGYFYYSEASAVKMLEEIDEAFKIERFDKDEFSKLQKEAEERENNMSISDKLKRGDEISFRADTIEAIRIQLIEENIFDKTTCEVYRDNSGHFKLREANEKTSEEILQSNDDKVAILPTEKVERKSIVYELGLKVKQSRFGIGVITEITDKRVVIDFENNGKKELLKQFANLETA